VSFDEQCEHSVSLVEIAAHGCAPAISTRKIKNIRPLHTIPAREPVDFDTALALLQDLNNGENAYVRLNVLMDGHLPHDAQTRAAQVLEEKNCRYCCIKRTLPPSAAARNPRRMHLEELIAKQPLDVANQFYSDKTGNAMTDLQREMFNEAFRQATVNS